MNINPEFEDNDISYNIDSEKEMDACMGVLKELLIDPMMESDSLDSTDKDVIDAIGVSLLLIAKKAKRFEEYVKQSNEPTSSYDSYEKSFNYRN